MSLENSQNMADSAKFYLLLLFNLWQPAIATASFLLLLLPLYCFTYMLRMHLDEASATAYFRNFSSRSSSRHRSSRRLRIQLIFHAVKCEHLHEN